MSTLNIIEHMQLIYVNMQHNFVEIQQKLTHMLT